MLRILNFSHPLTEEQFNTICEKSGANPILVEIINIPSQVSLGEALLPQIKAKLDALGFSDRDWQGGKKFLLRNPAYADSAVFVAAELYRRCGYWIPVITLKLAGTGGGILSEYQVSGIVDLNNWMEEAR